MISRHWPHKKISYKKNELKLNVRARDIIKDDYDLGHCHAMAIYALLKDVKKRD